MNRRRSYLTEWVLFFSFYDYPRKWIYICCVHRSTISFYRPIPNGFTSACLKPEHVDSRLQSCSHSSVFPDCRQWITEMIDLFPGVGILDSNGDLASWILRQDFGTMGMLHVVPKYRRTNLATVASMLLAQKVYEENYNVYSIVSVDNTASLALHKKHKLEKVQDFTVGFVKYQFQSLL